MLQIIRPLCTTCLLCLLWPAWAWPATNYPFSVVTEKSGQGHDLIARNNGPAPISLRLSLSSAENVANTQNWPIYAVIRPHSETVLTRINSAQRDRSLRFATQANYRPGNFYAIHDSNARYRLPFEDGRTFVISQAAGGPLSTHTDPESEYAVDFTLPENTPILAAREGVVIAAEDSNRFGGKDRDLLKMANHVLILHADESIATYAHLAANGIRVSVGQKVSAGTRLGLSGSTGYSSGPHLHFAVHQLLRKDTGFASVTVPVHFYVGNPPYVFEPQYLQVVTADYNSPGKAPPFAQRKRAVEAR